MLGRPLLRHEALAAQGWPAFWSKQATPGSGLVQVPWLVRFTEMAEAPAWRLVGNGMHVCSAYLVILYIFACSEGMVQVPASMPTCGGATAAPADSGDEEDCVMLGVPAEKRQKSVVGISSSESE